MRPDLGKFLADLAWQKIQDYDASRPRSLQEHIGPSEIGHVCDRQLAFKIARAGTVNPSSSSWRAIVGTAMHAHMENVLAPDPAWATEKTLQMVGITSGHSDAYYLPERCVVDWKFPGDTTIANSRRNGPTQTYQYQAQIYGLGWEDAGYDVESVAIIYLPVTSTIDKRYGWAVPYNRDLAMEALNRYKQLEDDVTFLDLKSDPTRINDFPKTPENCTWCPFYGSRKDEEAGRGCSGPVGKGKTGSPKTGLLNSIKPKEF